MFRELVFFLFFSLLWNNSASVFTIEEKSFNNILAYCSLDNWHSICHKHNHALKIYFKLYCQKQSHRHVLKNFLKFFWKIFIKTVFLKISKNLQENTCVRISFLIKLQAWGDSAFLWTLRNVSMLFHLRWLLLYFSAKGYLSKQCTIMLQ